MICVFIIYDGNSRRLNRKLFFGFMEKPGFEPATWMYMYKDHEPFPLFDYN